MAKLTPQQKEFLLSNFHNADNALICLDGSEDESEFIDRFGITYNQALEALRNMYQLIIKKM